MIKRSSIWKIVFATLLLQILLINANAQVKRIRVALKDAPFSRFVEAIEAESGCHFFYNEQDLDSFRVTIISDTFRLATLLKEVFRGTSFEFSIDGQLNVFVTRGQAIVTSLPASFFSPANAARAPDMKSDTVASTRKETKLSNANENKLYEIGDKRTAGRARGSVTGYIKDIRTGEPITGASVYIDSPYRGTSTDQFGYYSIQLPIGYHTIRISSVGMKDTRRQVLLNGDGQLNIELQEFVPALREVIVQSEKKSNVEGLQMGTERLGIKTIRQVPVIFGEIDVLRVVLALPGVSSVGEATTGFNVRGGAADQNLILFNDATIYNPSHLFGFFSVFNGDVVKSVELYKSTIPEKYGGRVSSVLDVAGRAGNNKKVSVSGGIGLLTARLTVEGPIIKDKTSFIVGARTTYSDWLLKTIPGTEYDNSSAGFSDFNLQLSHSINNKNNLHLTGYFSNDRFRLNNDTLYKYGNRNINLKWKHIFSSTLYAVFTGGADRYQYSVSADEDTANAFKLDFDINQVYFRGDFNYAPGTKHSINFGINSIYYKLHPGNFQPLGEGSLINPATLQAEQALESALYIGDQYNINSKLSFNAGLRYSFFNNRGPSKVYQYADGSPRTENTITDSVLYDKGETVKTYHGPEVRLALRYILSDNASLKASFNTLRQYIHTLSNTTSISPTDIWKLCDTYIQPQLGEQVSLGYYQNLRSNTIETSIEVYYKRLRNYLDYKSGAVLLMNQRIEADIINTRGRAYGVELMVRKPAGKLNGWINYTYARTELKMEDSLAGEVINNGEYYPASFDKPHTLNLIANYRFTHRVAVSLNTVYSTGRPITLPLAMFNYGGSQRVYYSERNQYRVPDYFRMDLSLNLEGNHKKKKLAHSSWSIGVYNLTFRQNPYSVYFVKEGDVIKGYQLSIFGTAIPFITYNFKF